MQDDILSNRGKSNKSSMKLRIINNKSWTNTTLRKKFPYS